MEIIEEVLTLLGGVTAAVFVIGYLSKFLVEQLAKKDIENHKNALAETLESYKGDLAQALETHKSNLGRDLEAYRADLAKLAIAHQYKTELIVKLRFEVLTDVWRMWVAVRRIVGAMTRPVVFEGEPTQEEQLATFQQTFGDFVEAFETRQVVFTVETAARIEEAIEVVHRNMWPIAANIKAVSKKTRSPVDPDEWKEAVDTLREQVPKIDQTLLSLLRATLDTVEAQGRIADLDSACPAP